MREAYEEAVTIARSLGDRALLASALFDLSFVPGMIEGDFAASEQIIREALEVAGEVTNCCVAASWEASASPGCSGEPAVAIDWFEQAIEIQQTIGDRFGVPRTSSGSPRCRCCSGMSTRRAPIFGKRRCGDGVERGPDARNRGRSQRRTRLLDGRHEDAARLVGAWERLERDHQVGFPDAMIARFADPAAAARGALGDEDTSVSTSRGLPRPRRHP